MPYIAYHGGRCCGVKHIFGFENHPDQRVNISHPTNAEFSCDHGQPGSKVSFSYPYGETMKDHFIRAVKHIEKHRPKGIIEIVLATNNCDQMAKWPPVLEENGFVLVSPKEGVKNGNSGNLLYVYHKYSGHKPAKAKKEA